jgi:hypothetical protein
VEHFTKEWELAKSEVKIMGNLEKNMANLPGIVEHRFNQLQEIEAVLSYLNIQSRKVKSEVFRRILTTSDRALTSRDSEKFAEGDEDVVYMDEIINEVALVRNLFLGITKGLEAKNFMVGHITKLRCAGMEDATL